MSSLLSIVDIYINIEHIFQDEADVLKYYKKEKPARGGVEDYCNLQIPLEKKILKNTSRKDQAAKEAREEIPKPEPWNSDWEEEMKEKLKEKAMQKAEEMKNFTPYQDGDWEEEEVPLQKIRLLKISW